MLSWSLLFNSFACKTYKSSCLIKETFSIKLGLGVGVGGGVRFRMVVVGGGRGPNSQQAHDEVTTSQPRHFDVICPLGF